MVERGGLENRCTFAGTVGSNPTPSASLRSSSFGWQATKWTGARRRLGVGTSAEAPACAKPELRYGEGRSAKAGGATLANGANRR